MLKFGMHVHQGIRSYGYIHPKSSHICVIHLVLERCCFEAVLPKRRLDLLGVNVYSMDFPVSRSTAMNTPGS